ncbi:hypothetical protein DDZ18_07540 [Marinicauda salina]|uniref:Protein MgtC n=1 Tax=Marinicauda salina TaxID=2135793 RepID=A0A2U2BU15_9PROT|nr:MgtC/SapB family protein [Marinicauda salina]PWE17515.1 hypothetical protein DDZ18_07540 [Marinicauda salina]
MPDWLSQPGVPAGFADSALRLLLAAVAGAVIGFEREKPERNAGLRTNMLVSLAACLFTLIAFTLAEAASVAGDAARADPIRVIEAVTAGVAFIAAGSIIRSGADVRGVTTAAALWLAGAVGVAFGAGAFGLGALAVALALIVLALIGRMETVIFKGREDED